MKVNGKTEYSPVRVYFVINMIKLKVSGNRENSSADIYIF